MIEIPRLPRWFRPVTSILAILLICFLLGYLIADLIVTYFSWQIPWCLKIVRTVEMAFIFVFVLAVQLLLHEVGHMLAGLFHGWRFISFYAFRLQLSFTEGKWHFSRKRIPGTAARCSMIPSSKGDSLQEALWYSAGGLVLNAVLALSGILFIWTGVSDCSFEILILSWSMIFSGLFLLIVNGLPQPNLSLSNDGTRMLLIRKDPASAEMFLRILSYQGQLQQGTPLNEIAHFYFFDMDKQVPVWSNPVHISAVLLDVELAMSKFDFDKAREILSIVKKKRRKIYSSCRLRFQMERIYLNLVMGTEDEAPLLEDDMMAFLERRDHAADPMVVRTLYVLAKFWEHDQEKAASLYEKSKALCASCYCPGVAETELKLIEFARLK